MSISDQQGTFRLIGVSAIVFLLIGLGGWYFFLSQRGATLEATGESRGFSVGIPSFSGSRGSALENLVQGLTPGTEISTTTSTNTLPPRLWQINQTPVAGAGFITQGSTTLIRFVERSNGHVFDANIETGEVMRRTNTSLGTIYEAHIGSENNFILRTLDASSTVHTLLGTFGTTTENGLRELDVIDVGPTHTAAFRGGTPLLLAGNQKSRLVASTTNTKEQVLFTSPILKWHIERSNPLVIVEPAASGVVGSAFSVGAGGTLTPLATKKGLTLAAHPESNVFLVGEEGENVTLSVLSGTTTQSLSIQTVAEKCTWAPGRALIAYCAVPKEALKPGFLDAWYRGATHTSDRWHTIESTSGASEILYAPNESIELDVEYPAIDESARYILFMNARDKSLWALRIYE